MDEVTKERGSASEPKYLELAGNAVPGAKVEDEREHAVTALLNQLWFTRAWIVQEVSVAKSALLIYGRQERDGEIFSNGIEAGLCKGGFQTVYLDILRTEDIQYLRALSSVRNTIVQSFPVGELFNLLIQFRRRHATNPRDKGFSLLGMIDGSFEELRLQPDYHLSIMEVYSKTAAAIISKLSNLDILGGMCNRS